MPRTSTYKTRLEGHRYTGEVNRAILPCVALYKKKIPETPLSERMILTSKLQGNMQVLCKPVTLYCWRCVRTIGAVTFISWRNDAVRLLTVMLARVVKSVTFIGEIRLLVVARYSRFSNRHSLWPGTIIHEMKRNNTSCKQKL